MTRFGVGVTVIAVRVVSNIPCRLGTGILGYACFSVRISVGVLVPQGHRTDTGVIVVAIK